MIRKVIPFFLVFFAFLAMFLNIVDILRLLVLITAATGIYSSKLNLTAEKKAQKHAVDKIGSGLIGVVLQYIPIAATAYDTQGKIMHINSEFEKLTGYSMEELEGKNYFEFIDRVNVKEANSSSGSKCLIKLQDKNGCVKLVNCEAYPLVIGGEYLGYMSILKNVPEEKQTELFQEVSHAILQSVDFGCIAVNCQERITIINKAAKRMLGKTGDMSGKKLEAVLPKGSRLHVLLTRTLRGKKGSFKEMPVVIEKRNHVLLVSSEPIKYGGNISGAVLIFKDITEKREKDLADRERERLAAIGQLAAGVAHEIRQPLTSIRGFAQLLKRETGTSNKLKSYCKIIVDEMDRLNEIISEFLELARPCKLVTNTVSLNKIVKDVVKLVEDRCSMKGIDIELKPCGFLPEIEVDETKIKQVILNVVSNAIDAMDEHGGTLTFSTGREGDYVTLSISDTGIGIPEEQIDKVLTPFFTTKPDGTGLGLSICRRIMEQHKGQLEITSKEGKGTTVKLKFVRRLPWVQEYLFVKDLEETAVEQ